ncbi:hypothetical protein BKA82DRAFT_1004065 [Pisolithus tinctorius]|uniref:Uncharacterized protein n=1 Tax=Pisolithus tinctorius Marx 270 TaxID=870435 RepID=A0A0C3NGG4_PISTI|nr:hypothetical protein BKA82DRAFT_1004065 [Pisolithus tinctorius]KIO00140.1 hypothetical protein M404DRAFT_1004065 [Pisolithus tinctorius Marx 270]
MDELTEARAALATMENRERELLSELRSIRDAVRLQRSRVEELITRLPISPIDRLPNESLLRVLEFCLEEAAHTCDVYIHAKRELASVSRRWRDLILHSPSLWTLLTVTSSWSEARAKIYMTRSSQSLLDIVIRFYGYGYDDRDGIFTTLLSILTSGAHRWRSLTICEDTTHFHRSLMLEKLNHLSFPSLKRVSISNYPGSLTWQGELYQPLFLHPRISPHLEQVNLDVDVSASAAVHIPSGVTDLSLQFYDHDHIQHSSLFEGHYCLGLTSLSISGHAVDFNLPPNSIQLPLLEKFVCTLSCAKSLIHALVAPRLRHFDYSPSSWNDSPSTIFADLLSKFNSVGYLHLSGSTAHILSEAVCMAFPNVCDLQLTPFNDVLSDSCPADFLGDALHWKDLKNLTIYPPDGSDLESLDGLVAWLLQRLNAGQSKLHVTVTTSGCGIPSLFQKLTELCYLEWLDICCDVAVTCHQSGSQAWVEVLNLPACVVNELSTALTTGNVRGRVGDCQCGSIYRP